MGCHVNPTGGELRAQGGESFAIEQLPMWNRGDKFTGAIGDNFRLGMDFRSQYISYVDAVTTPSDSFGGVKSARLTNLRTFQAMAMPLYISAQLTKTLVLFGRYDFFYGQSEAWGLLHFVHPSGEIIKAGDVVGDAYIKAGAFEPAFGIRFDDHTIYTRNGDGQLRNIPTTGLFWSPEYRDVGLELGTTLLDHLGFTVGCFQGQETTPGQNLSIFDTSGRLAVAARGVFSTEIVEDMLSVEVGGSYYGHTLHTNAFNSTSPLVSSTLSALHGGVRAGPVTVMTEFDFANNLPTSNGVLHTAKAMVVQGDVKITKGLDGYIRFDNYSDADTNGVLGTNVKSRYSLGFQWVPIRFLELRPEFRIAKVVAPDANFSGQDQHTETTFFIQTHVYF
jgi:hypothetical protein